jgi:hypothetical protein
LAAKTPDEAGICAQSLFPVPSSPPTRNETITLARRGAKNAWEGAVGTAINETCLRGILKDPDHPLIFFSGNRMTKTILILLGAVFLLGAVSLSRAGAKPRENDFDVAVAENRTRTGTISVQITSKRALSIRRVTKQGNEYQEVSSEGGLSTRQKGFPEVGYFKIPLQLKDNRNYKLVVHKNTFDERSYEGKWLPSRGNILRSMDPDKIPYQMRRDALVDAYYPGNDFVTLEDPYLIRDVRGIDLVVYPVLVNTLQRRVKILREIDIELVPLEQGRKFNTQPRRPLRIFSQNAPFFDALFANFRWDYELDDGPGHMLVIYTGRDRVAIQPFIAHKKSLGFTVVEQEVEPKTNVKDIIKNAYDADPSLFYVQLVGDWDDIRCDMYQDPDSQKFCPKDNALGLVSGSDNYYDLIISRFSAVSAQDVSTQVNKVITYETNRDPLWWKRGLGIASEEGTGDDDEYDYEHMDIIKQNRLIPFGYGPVYAEYAEEASASGVTTAVNEGVHVINYAGHGDMDGWVTTGFDTNDVEALINGSRLPIIFSVACSVGEYHSGTCFAETWLRKEDGGAVAALMSTISQPWAPPMRGQDYMNDLLTWGYDYETNPGIGISTDHGKIRLGPVIFNAFNLQIAEAAVKQFNDGDVETTQTWIVFGDGSLLLAPPCPDCCGNRVDLQDVTFKARSDCHCEGITSLTLGRDVIVEKGASVIFEAPTVRITPGFEAGNGSHVKIRDPQ